MNQNKRKGNISNQKLLKSIKVSTELLGILRLKTKTNNNKNKSNIFAC